MDTEVGRGVGVSSTWFQAGAGRASTADACQAPGRGDRCRGCEPEIRGLDVRASPSSGGSGLGTSGPLGGPGDGSEVTLPMLLEPDALLTQ